jgi:predicted nucleotidyltransferase
LSKKLGEWLSKRLRLLRSWHEVTDIVSKKVRSFVPEAQIYVFGSVIEGRVTGSSDLDLIVVVPDNVNELEFQVKLYKVLEEEMGENAYIVDLHVVHRSKVDKPPYKWWLKRAVLWTR